MQNEDGQVLLKVNPNEGYEVKYFKNEVRNLKKKKKHLYFFQFLSKFVKNCIFVVFNSLIFWLALKKNTNFQENITFVILSSSNSLTMDGKLISEAVTSFILHDDLICYTTFQNRLHIVDMRNGKNMMERKELFLTFF